MKLIELLFTSLYTQFLTVCIGIILIRNSTNPTLKTVATVLMVLFVLLMLFYSIVKKLYRNVSYHLAVKCDCTLTQAGLQRLKSYDFLGIYRKRIFMLECIYMIDTMDKKAIADFIDRYVHSTLLTNPECLISLDITRLYFYYIIQNAKAFRDLYAKYQQLLTEKNMRKLKEITVANVKALASLIDEEYQKTETYYEAIDMTKITNHELCYHDVFCAFAMLGQKKYEEARNCIRETENHYTSSPFLDHAIKQIRKNCQ